VSDLPRFDVVGIGNALVDVIAHADDEFLDQEALVKGSMTLIDTDRAVHLHRAIGPAVEMSGGSAANTVCGVASFGGRAAYVGKVSGDDLGDVFGSVKHRGRAKTLEEMDAGIRRAVVRRFRRCEER
jgi:hypothetical protein